MSHLGHGVERLFETRLFLLRLTQLELPLVELALQLAHLLLPVRLGHLLHEPQLIGVPLLQLPGEKRARINGRQRINDRSVT